MPCALLQLLSYSCRLQSAALRLRPRCHVQQGDPQEMHQTADRRVPEELIGELRLLCCNDCHLKSVIVTLLYISASCHASSRPLPSIARPKHLRAHITVWNAPGLNTHLFLNFGCRYSSFTVCHRLFMY